MRLALLAAVCVLARPGAASAAQTTATGVSIGAPDVGDTFEVGEGIIVTLTFSAAVDVWSPPFGSVWLELSIGSRTRNATFLSGSGTASPKFRYWVVTSDVDTDGISIGANAVRLNGVSIRPVGSTMNARLGLGTHAVSNSANHKVAGGTFTTPSVAGAALAGGPASGDTYGRGEEIEVRIRDEDGNDVGTDLSRFAITDASGHRVDGGSAIRAGRGFPEWTACSRRSATSVSARAPGGCGRASATGIRCGADAPSIRSWPGSGVHRTRRPRDWGSPSAASSSSDASRQPR